VKLDLLYEMRPKIGPAYASFPDRQQRFEQEAYREAIEQFQFADELGLHYRGIELLATQVIPALEARGHRVNTTTVVA
jgi:hypothetical protein